MEQMPHHREGIQNDLGKAYDEGHLDNETLDVVQAMLAEIKGADIAGKEYGDIGDKEARGQLSLEETIALLKESGYLDTSFEGKEVHELAIRPLSKEEALDEYCGMGGVVGAWEELEKNVIPYTKPKAENLDVIIINFRNPISNDAAIEKMSTLGVRPLTYEELIQYGIKYPSHQEKEVLCALGSKYAIKGDTLWAHLFVGSGQRILRVTRSNSGYLTRYLFPVVRK